MGLESVFQYVGLAACMILPPLVIVSIFPWNFRECLHNWKIREKRYFKIFAFKYWLLMILLGLTLLFYFGGMFEVVRTGGTYMGWNTSTSPLIVSSLGAIFSLSWFPLWFIPLRIRDFLISHIQALAIFFTILGFLLSLDYTASAWFMLPLCILNVFLWYSMWSYEEKHSTVYYKGEDLNE